MGKRPCSVHTSAAYSEGALQKNERTPAIDWVGSDEVSQPLGLLVKPVLLVGRRYPALALETHLLATALQFALAGLRRERLCATGFTLVPFPQLNRH